MKERVVYMEQQKDKVRGLFDHFLPKMSMPDLTDELVEFEITCNVSDRYHRFIVSSSLSQDTHELSTEESDALIKQVKQMAEDPDLGYPFDHEQLQQLEYLLQDRKDTGRSIYGYIDTSDTLSTPYGSIWKVKWRRTDDRTTDD